MYSETNNEVLHFNIRKSIVVGIRQFYCFNMYYYERRPVSWKALQRPISWQKTRTISPKILHRVIFALTARPVRQNMLPQWNAIRKNKFTIQAF